MQRNAPFIPFFSTSKSPENFESILGIDLGFKNSYASIFYGNQLIDLKNSKGSVAIPSLVGLNNDGKWIAGEQVIGVNILFWLNNLQSKIIVPKNIFLGFEKLIGRKYEHLKNQDPNNSFMQKVIGFKHGDCAIDVNGKWKLSASLIGKPYPPEFLQSLLLREICSRIINLYNIPIKKAIVTVPGFYCDLGRQAIIDSGDICDLKIVRLITEPTAASMAYLYQNKFENLIFAVVNLSDGYIDVAIFEWMLGVIEVKSIGSVKFCPTDVTISA